jgi:hypothetical protein
MTIQFEIPNEIEEELAASGTDVNGEARLAFLVELYRRGACDRFGVIFVAYDGVVGE